MMRFALAFVALVLLALSFDAHATTRSAAHAQCTAAGATVSSTNPEVNSWTCTDTPNGGTPDPNDGYYACTYMYTFPNDGGTIGPFGCDGYYPTASSSYPYNEPEDCSTREPQLGGWYADSDPNTSNDVCSDGCMMEYVLELAIGGEGYSGNAWYPSGATCTAEETPEPEDDADSDGTPDDEDAFPDDPNESEDTDGDGTGDNSDTSDDDPTDGADDGEGNEADNVASGGGTCGAPPSCSGDGIQCAQLFQQWKTRCNTEGENVTVAGAGGDCDVPLVCSGDKIQCAQLRETRAMRCAAGEDEDYDDVDGSEGETPEDLAVASEQEIDISTLDSSGWLSRSCPSIPTFHLGALGTYDPEIPGWCNLLEVIGAMIMGVACLVAIRIVGS